MAENAEKAKAKTHRGNTSATQNWRLWAAVDAAVDQMTKPDGHRNTRILYMVEAHIVGDSVKKPPKYIIECVDDETASNIVNALHKVSEQFPHKNLKTGETEPWPIKVRVIHPVGNITLSETAAYTVKMMSSDDIVKRLKEKLSISKKMIEMKYADTIESLENQKKAIIDAADPEDLSRGVEIFETINKDEDEAKVRRSEELETADAKYSDYMAGFTQYAESHGFNQYYTRWRTGISYRVTYFDADTGRRNQMNVGDVLIAVCDECAVVQATIRKIRTDRRTDAILKFSDDEGEGVFPPK